MNTGHSTNGETDVGVVEHVVGEQLYDALFEHGNRVAMLLEPDERVVDANAPALALGAFDRDDDIGEPVWAMPLFTGTASRAVRADVPGLGRADRVLDRIDTLLEDVHTGGCNSFTRQSLLAAETDPFRLDSQFECLRTYSHQYQSVAEGSAIEERTRLGLGTVARAAWEHVDTGDATLVVESTTHLLADETRLMQIFENLLENAVEHGPTGPNAQSSTLTVRVGATESGFYVADEGCGLPENAFGSVFDAGVTTTSDSTGFGLSIVESIIRGHGWAIEAGESADGGARFDVLTDPEDPDRATAHERDGAVAPQ